MDVDIPQIDETMETDPPIVEPPQLTRKDSILDPDGDEVMQGEEEEYDGDIVLGGDDDDEEGGEEIEAEEHEEYEGDDDVDLDGGDQGIGETQDESLDTQEDTGVIDSTASASATRTTLTEDPAPTATQVITPDTTVPAPIMDNAGNASTENVASETKQISANEHPETNGEEDKTENAVGQDEVSDQAEPMLEGEHAEGDHDDEDEEEGEEYDLITPQTLPPIILNLPNTRVALFNPPTSEDGIAIPVWFAERLEELCEGTLTQLWAAIRAKLDEEGQGNDDEMVVIEKLMDLKMGDVSLFLLLLSSLSFAEGYGDVKIRL